MGLLFELRIRCFLTKMGINVIRYIPMGSNSRKRENLERLILNHMKLLAQYKTTLNMRAVPSDYFLAMLLLMTEALLNKLQIFSMSKSKRVYYLFT